MTALSPGASAEAGPLRLSREARVAIALVLAGSVVAASIGAGLAVGDGPSRPNIVDFHPFYLAGRLALEGHFADSYRMPLMRALERTFGGGRDVWMPFVYPPLFGLVMAPFALLPVGLAFLLFEAATLAFYLAVLRRLAGAWFWTVILPLSPVILLDVAGGQNGLLTGALAGLAVAASLDRRSGLAGAAAGALAFKPQVAAMLPLLFLSRRDARAVLAAAATALVLTVAAVLWLGTGTVAGFLSSTSATAGLMNAGVFPLHRMVSVYACALGFGVPRGLALALHAAVALAVMGFSLAEGLRSSRGGPDGAADPRGAAGLTLSATAFVSPYLFDYDLTVYGIGFAMLLPALAKRMNRRSLSFLLALVALGGASGLLGGLAGEVSGVGPSLGAPVLLASWTIALGALRRRRSREDEAEPAPHARAVPLRPSRARGA